jgi:hypothetical protein
VGARAPLDEETLHELMLRRKVLVRGNEARSLEKLKQGLDAVQTMLRAATLPGGGFGYEPYHLTFREHVRKDEAGIIGDQNQLAREEFCKLTGDWASLPADHSARQYALRRGFAFVLLGQRRP